MEKKQQNHDPTDELDKALDQFDNNQLNLTDEQPKLDLDEDPQTAAKIKEQYDKFMQEMKNFGGLGGGQQQGLDNLTSMLGGLLKNLTSQTGDLGGDQSQITKGFQQMFKSLKQENIQQAAGKLLSQFMNKDLLYQPLVEAKQHYNEYFEKNKENTNVKKQDLERYHKQYDVLEKIIEALDKQPDQKDKLINLFEEMQTYGTPPEGITSPGAFM